MAIHRTPIGHLGCLEKNRGKHYYRKIDEEIGEHQEKGGRWRRERRGAAHPIVTRAAAAPLVPRSEGAARAGLRSARGINRRHDRRRRRAAGLHDR